jgi:hypothetical protein
MFALPWRAENCDRKNLGSQGPTRSLDILKTSALIAPNICAQRHPWMLLHCNFSVSKYYRQSWPVIVS